MTNKEGGPAATAHGSRPSILAPSAGRCYPEDRNMPLSRERCYLEDRKQPLSPERTKI